MRVVLAALAMVLGAMSLGGCAGAGHKHGTRALPTAEFQQAGPLRPEVDMGRMIRARRPEGEYRLICGDVLELQMPAMTMLAPSDRPDEVSHFRARIDEQGRVHLPVIGAVEAEGLTVNQLEERIADTYYPRYVTHRPVITAQIKFYETQRVSVVGAVREPGVYDLRHDEMSLVTAVLKAGGITEDNGGTIRIRRGTSSEEARALMLPVRGVDVPFVDVDLRPGDTIEIERREPEQFTVIGLVRRPGAFAYPNGSEYTLLQALATAGGTDELADPRYATIYRQTAGGELVHATYAIQKLGGEDGNPRIKPGDVVAVEHTARTQFRVLMARLLRIGVGAGADVSYKPF